MATQNIAYYLKYRPQNLQDLIGQESVKKIISGAFVSNKLSHAYLFVGPRGTGKTSTARILAKMVNCQRIKESEESKVSEVPCNKCDSCISITDGSNLDLIEIDAASNRGIEDIRLLREKIKLAPSFAKKKIYIIDEVHMLTTEAFNALLKTLEEPPKHALFILATTDVGKLPSTILSRVQRLDFQLASKDQLMDALKKIVASEKIDIDEEALKLLVKKSDGSFRDGVKLLDQVAAIEGKIKAKTLEENLKSSSFDEILDLIETLFEKNINKSLLNISKQIEQGTDIKELTLSLMEGLRNVMFIKNGLGNKLVEPGIVADKYQQLVSLSEKVSNQELIRILDILQNSLGKLKVASIPTLPMELAVVEICFNEEPARLVAKNRSTSESKSLSNSPVSLEARKQTTDYTASSPHFLTDPDFAGLPQKKEMVDNSSKQTKSETSESSDILKVKEKWNVVLETIRPYNFSLEALLRSTNIRECSDTTIIMEVPYSFHQRILEAPKNRDILEGILSDILGRSIHVAIILGNRPARKEDIANIETAADDEIIRAAAEIFNSDTIN